MKEKSIKSIHGGGKEATTFADALHSHAVSTQAERPIAESPRPSPAERLGRSAARPLPLAGLLAQTSAGGGCAEQQPVCLSPAVRDYIDAVTQSQLRQIEAPYAPDPCMTSVVSYPQRCNLWGLASFRGNCDGTLFKELVLRYQPRSVADPMMGSGTTKDVIAGLNHHLGLNIRYWGSDLAQGFNASMRPLPGHYDLVWVHPPYWNIIRFTSALSDLSRAATYGEYLVELRRALRNCVQALNAGGRLVVLVGDVRFAGRYVPIVRDILNWEGELGELRSIIIKAQHNCRSNSTRYPPMEDVKIQHEYCVVFRRNGIVAEAPQTSYDSRGVHSLSGEGLP